jgi:hypothetical protein
MRLDYVFDDCAQYTTLAGSKIASNGMILQVGYKFYPFLLHLDDIYEPVGRDSLWLIVSW